MINSQTFEQAYNSQFTSTLRFLVSRGIDQSSAEEVSQAAWARGWERRGQLRDDSKIGYWVNTIALNLLRRRKRCEKRETPLEPNLDRPTTSTVEQRVDAEKMLRDATDDDRQILLMNVVEGRTSKEIARRTGCSPVSIRVRLHRLRTKLRAKHPHRSASRRSARH